MCTVNLPHPYTSGKLKSTFTTMGSRNWNRVLEGNLTVCIKNFKIPYSFNITPKTILVASLKEYAGLYAKVSFKALFRRAKQQKAKQFLKYISHVQKEGRS